MRNCLWILCVAMGNYMTNVKSLIKIVDMFYEINFSSHLGLRLQCDIALRNPFRQSKSTIYTKRKLEHEHLLQVIYAYVWELHFLVLSLISLLGSHRGTTGLHTLRSSIYKWLYWGFCMWPPEHVFCFEVVHYEVLMHPEYLKKK